METSKLISPGEYIYLIFDHKRRWLLKVEPDNSFHTDRGIIEFNDIIGKRWGCCVFSRPLETQGYKFFVLKPTPSDYALHIVRKTQIIYPKDAGLILLYGDIKPGSIIIEAGCGSGALGVILANYVKPNGHVFSYDISEKSLKQARRNLELTGLKDYITIAYGDITKNKLNHSNIDTIILDLATPWEAIPLIREYLKDSGIVVSFSPTIEQVKKTYFSLKRNDFFEVSTHELLKREMQIKENATRPHVRMIGHSGYITVGRKINNIPNPYRSRKPKEKEIIDMSDMPLRGDL